MKVTSMTNSTKKIMLLLVCSAMLFAMSLLAGCKGDNGAAGSNGQDVTPIAAIETCTVCHDSGRAADPAALHPGLQTPAAVNTVISAVSTSTTGTSTNFVINFSITGAGVLSSLTSTTSSDSGKRLASLRFAYAKLKTAANAYDPDVWVSYTTRDADVTKLTDLGSGNFRYVSAKYDNTTLFDPAVINRVMLMVSGSAVADPTNTIYDFVPNGAAAPATRDIVTTAACNECHNKLGSPQGNADFHSGSRFEAKACATCHTTALGGGAAEFAPMVHKIHAAKKDFGLGDFSEVTLPQALFNCRKCHKGTDGDHWKTKPIMTACATCHDVVFSSASVTTGFTLHSGGEQADNSECATCHPNNLTSTNAVPVVHMADDASPNNPDVPTGAVNFSYEISSVTTDNNQPVVKFRVLGDANATPVTPVTLICDSSSSTTANTLLSGFSGSPSFLVAFALPQDGVTTMVDYNNLGNAAAQPASVSIANVCNGTQGSMTGPDASGYYTATLTGSSNAAVFPADATLRSVSLQGYFTQVSPALARHTVSVVKGVTGDTARRSVVDPAKCGLCHEFFQGHGGNRVYETQVCVVCHVPNLSSSGRGASVANLSAANADALTAAGFDATKPETWPEKSMNFKDLIHSTHASAKRTNPFQFVRDRGTSGVYFYDMSEVTFPGVLSDCETCHISGTYDVNMPSVLPSTNVTTDGNASTAVADDRKNLPNDKDLVISPTASACIACHDADVSMTHTLQNGASIDVTRDTGK